MPENETSSDRSARVRAHVRKILQGLTDRRRAGRDETALAQERAEDNRRQNRS